MADPGGFTLGLLGVRVTVTCDEPGLAGLIEDRFGHLRAGAGDAPGHRLDIRHTDGAPATWAFTVDGTPSRIVHDPAVVTAQVVWELNTLVLHRTPHASARVHAAVAAGAYGAVVLPADSHAGKSTLVASLAARAGLRYYSDEAAVFDADGRVLPYAKPVTLREGATGLGLVPPPDRALPWPYEATTWLVTPAELGTCGPQPPAEVRAVVFPRYEPGAPTELTPLSRAAALADLAVFAFSLGAGGREAFRHLARAVSGARCARLVSGDLAEATAAVCHLLEETP